MEQYISKSALITEIEKRRDKNTRNKLNLAAAFEDNYLLSFINALETKEADLDDKGEWKNTGGFGSTWDPDSHDYYPD